jgi:hypothetical protein
MAIRTHNERCRDCKERVRTMLSALFGRVEANWDLNLPARLDDYTETIIFESLKTIHDALIEHRGFDRFVKSRKLPRVDFFIPDKKIIIEFDESQHFTKPRDVALGLYPRGKKYGFFVEKWRVLCEKLNRRDNDPLYRDEQRAWYDTLRDLSPILWGGRQTVRLYSRDFIWCSLRPDRQSDLLTFKRFIMKKRSDQC